MGGGRERERRRRRKKKKQNKTEREEGTRDMRMPGARNKTLPENSVERRGSKKKASSQTKRVHNEAIANEDS